MCMESGGDQSHGEFVSVYESEGDQSHGECASVNGECVSVYGEYASVYGEYASVYGECMSVYGDWSRPVALFTSRPRRLYGDRANCSQTLRVAQRYTN